MDASSRIVGAASAWAEPYREGRKPTRHLAGQEDKERRIAKVKSPLGPGAFVAVAPT
jgi:hypothetical protein